MFLHNENPFDPLTGKINPTTRWLCDRCMAPIESADDGIAWWAVSPQDTSPHSHLLLRHRIGTCPVAPLFRTAIFPAPDEFLEVSLRLLVGPDGLMRLIRLHEKGYWTSFELSRLVERIHCPGFESVRTELYNEASEGRFTPSDIGWFATQEYIAEKLLEGQQPPRRRSRRKSRLFMPEIIKLSAEGE